MYEGNNHVQKKLNDDQIIQLFPYLGRDLSIFNSSPEPKTLFL